MAKNYSGRDMLFYVTEPTAPSVAATASDYTLVGLSTGVNINSSRNAIDKSNKDDGDESTFVAGRRNSTISGSCFWDHTSDTGQDHFQDAFESSNGTIYFLCTSTTNNDVEFHGSGIVTQKNLSFPDEGISQLDFEIQVSGALTEVTGTTT